MTGLGPSERVARRHGMAGRLTAAVKSMPGLRGGCSGPQVLLSGADFAAFEGPLSPHFHPDGRVVTCTVYTTPGSG